MKALRVHSFTGWDISLDELSRPVPGPGELLIRTEAVGLCGSDVHACRGDQGYEWMQLPVVLGHEAVGTVVAVGHGVSNERLGRRVAMVAIQGCGNCSICTSGGGHHCPERTCIGLHQDGALAEYFTIAENRVVKVDRNIDPVLGALYEPAAVVLHATDALPQNLSGQTVAITGPGTIGLLSGMECRRRGADVWIFGHLKRDRRRLTFAEGIGMNTRGAPQGGFDFWVEASGSQAGLNRAIEETSHQASIAIPALFGRLPEVNMNDLVRKGLSLHGSYGYSTRHFTQAAELIEENESALHRMITTYSIDQAPQALSATAAGEVIKALVVFESAESATN